MMSNNSKLSKLRMLKKRARVMGVSALGLVVSVACSLFRRDRDEVEVLCYRSPDPNYTPTPVVECYEAIEVDEPEEPSPAPTMAPESREVLLDKVMNDGALPKQAANILRTKN